MSTQANTLSVVIPVLGDTDAVLKLVNTLANMPARPDEIIVVDGGASDDCRTCCKETGVHYLASEPGRGRQLAAGARRASGKWLWFLHADAEPDLDSAEAIRRSLANGRVGGWFRFRFANVDHWLARLLAGLVNLRCRFGIPYGDQGLFMSAAAYREAGGFPPDPLFEEVPLVKALRRLGRFEALPLSLGVSPRRWQRDGWLRRSLSNRQLALAYMLGAPPAKLAQRYETKAADKATRC